MVSVFFCHQCANTLDAPDVNGDGEIGVLDIDCIFTANKP